MNHTINVTDIFASNVFDDATMRERLPKRIYQELKQAANAGYELDKHVADVVANAMKDWAIERGATHYSHWFQPLTGTTLRRSRTPLSLRRGIRTGSLLEEFSGKELIKGRAGRHPPSLPAGLRSTFEARGYTAWDLYLAGLSCTKMPGGAVLCIPNSVLFLHRRSAG